MSPTIPQAAATTAPPDDDIASQVARLREQVLDLRETVAALTAEVGRQNARITALPDAMRAAYEFPGLPGRGIGAQSHAHTDPVVLKIQDQRRRITASGLRVLPGGAR